MATWFNTQTGCGKYHLQFETDDREKYLVMQEVARRCVDGTHGIIVPFGRWENQDSSYTRFRCSNCKCNNFSGRWKYCPACGAKMDG